jgi:hypothetical protein
MSNSSYTRCLPAGLTTSDVVKAGDRGKPTNRSTYYPPCPYRVVQPPDDSSTSSPKCVDIPGSSPSKRPLFASSFTPCQFQTQRSTCPLDPTYSLPGWSKPFAGESCTPSSSRPCSQAGLVSPGRSELAREDSSSRFSSPAGLRAAGARSPHRSSLDVTDIMVWLPSPSVELMCRVLLPCGMSHAKLQPMSRSALCFGVPTSHSALGPGVRTMQSRKKEYAPRASMSLCTSDISGASRGRSSSSSPVRMPGLCGTLHCSDILGASPGKQRPVAAAAAAAAVGAGPPSTFMMGRWPAPQTTKHQFEQTPRRTVLQRPLNFKY